MEATAFCPAHITGFFKAKLEEGVQTENLGSMGAGFSIKEGVITKVVVSERKNEEDNFQISIDGFQSDKTDVSEFVINEFMKISDLSNKFLEIKHQIDIPVGYGLGSSSAVALSLAFALDKALNTKLTKNKIGIIAHNAEVNCKTGLGDVLASIDGGFEIRTKAGGPGIGEVEKIPISKISIVMVCFSPISTKNFIKEKISKINGLGGKMVNKLQLSKDYQHFEDMSLEFAKYVNVITPKMQLVIDRLTENNFKCGVALFGETIFTMIEDNEKENVLKILKEFDGVIIESELDETGVRILNN